MEKIILASQSPRRKQLLEWAEIPFEIKVKETAETFPPDLAIEEVPVFIAREKARVIDQGSLQGSLIGTFAAGPFARQGCVLVDQALKLGDCHLGRRLQIRLDRGAVLRCHG